MSRAKPEAQREKDDLYITPPGCVAPLLDELAPLLPTRPYVLDPGAGSGSISQAVLDCFPRAWVDAAELQYEHANDLRGIHGPETTSENGRLYQTSIYRIHWGDFLQVDPEWRWRRWDYSKNEALGADLGGPDLVVSNPPYRIAEEFVRRSIEISDGFVAMLLRVGFLESQRRYPFWSEFPPIAQRVLVERPSFTPDGGTDSAAYAWFIWRGRGYEPENDLTGPEPFGWYRWHDQA